MNKLASIVLLASVLSTTGCGTVVGGMTGGIVQSASNSEARDLEARGHGPQPRSTAFRTGLLVGVALDALIVFALARSDTRFCLGPCDGDQ